MYGRRFLVLGVDKNTAQSRAAMTHVSCTSFPPDVAAIPDMQELLYKLFLLSSFSRIRHFGELRNFFFSAALSTLRPLSIPQHFMGKRSREREQDIKNRAGA